MEITVFIMPMMLALFFIISIGSSAAALISCNQLGSNSYGRPDFASFSVQKSATAIFNGCYMVFIHAPSDPMKNGKVFISAMGGYPYPTDLSPYLTNDKSVTQLPQTLAAIHNLTFDLFATTNVSACSAIITAAIANQTEACESMWPSRDVTGCTGESAVSRHTGCRPSGNKPLMLYFINKF